MTSALRWGRVVNATAQPLYPRERPGTHSTGGWMGPRADLDRCGKSPPTGIRSPDRPARSESLYRLSFPGRHWYQCIKFILLLLRGRFLAGQLHDLSPVPVPKVDSSSIPIVLAWNTASRSLVRTRGPRFDPVPFHSTETTSPAWNLCCFPHFVQVNAEWYPVFFFDLYLPHGF